MKAAERIPENDKTEEMKRAEIERKIPFFATRRGRGISALLMILVIVVFMTVFMSGGGSITVEMDASKMGIVCLNQTPIFIDYKDIVQVELVSALQTGSAISVQEWDNGFCGIYENETYGKYTLYAYSGTDQYIVVHYKDGVLVFNDKNRKNTQREYEELMEHCFSEAE